jgi:hypothetical protein
MPASSEYTTHPALILSAILATGRVKLVRSKSGRSFSVDTVEDKDVGDAIFEAAEAHRKGMEEVLSSLTKWETVAIPSS